MLMILLKIVIYAGWTLVTLAVTWALAMGLFSLNASGTNSRGELQSGVIELVLIVVAFYALMGWIAYRVWIF